MKTYVVNMAKDVAKRTIIERQLQSHPELDYQIFEAVEGRKLTDFELMQLGYPEFKNKYRDFGTLPAFGCSVSHYNLYKRIVSECDEVAMILEDDAIIPLNLSLEITVIEEFFRNKKNVPVVVLLTPDFIYKKKNLCRLGNSYLGLTEISYGYMTSGYIVNNMGARLLSNSLFPIRYIADEWSEFKKMGLNLYGVVPHLVSFPEDLGEIGQSQLVKKESFIRKSRHVLGRFKGRIYEMISYAKGYRKSCRKW